MGPVTDTRCSCTHRQSKPDHRVARLCWPCGDGPVTFAHVEGQINQVRQTELGSSLLAATPKWNRTLTELISQTESRVSKTLIVCDAKVHLPASQDLQETAAATEIKDTDAKSQTQTFKQTNVNNHCTSILQPLVLRRGEVSWPHAP